MLLSRSDTSLIGRNALLSLVLLSVLQTLFVNAINPLVIKGNKFFDSVTGHHVIIRGIDYYPRPNNGTLNANSIDFFTNDHKHIWSRDVYYFKELGINAVRLYSVDPTKDHDAFMCALAEAGIYVTVGIASEGKANAVTKDPAPKCYPPQLKDRAQAVINKFAKYPNVMAFSMGNEVNHVVAKPSLNAPCQKKLIRDMREYVASCDSIRNIPIGLVIADSDRIDNMEYYNCQSDPKDEFEAAQWYGLNTYLGCDVFNTSYVHAYNDSGGFAGLVTDMTDLKYSIPVLLSEFGCLNKDFPNVDGYEAQRTFQQAKWLWDDSKMRDILAGGFAFEYSIEKTNLGPNGTYPFKKYTEGSYGIGYFSPEDCDDIKVPCKYNPMPAFENLKNAFKVDQAHLGQPHMDDYNVFNNDRSKCPDNFPSIHKFRWPSDRHRNSTVSCPAKDEQLEKATNIVAKCHAFNYKHEKDFEKEWQVTTSQSAHSHTLSWYPLSIFVAIISFVMGWFAQKLYKYYSNRKEGYEPLSGAYANIIISKDTASFDSGVTDEESNVGFPKSLSHGADSYGSAS